MRELERLQGNGYLTTASYRLDNLKDTVTVENAIGIGIGIGIDSDFLGKSGTG